MAALGLVAVAILGRVALRNPDERLRAAGIGCVLIAVVTMALGVGWSRGTMEETYCLNARYTTLSCPLVIALYAVFSLYGPRMRSRWVDMSAAAVPLIIGLSYVPTGVHQSQEIRARVARMEVLIAEGFSTEAVAQRCSGDVQDKEPTLVGHLNQMRDGRIGPYRNLPASLPTIEAVVQWQSDHVDTGPRKRSTVSIGSDHPWAQPLILPPGECIFRVDVRVRTNLHRSPLPSALDWQLVEHTSAGHAVIKASGQCALDELADPMFATLRFSPFLVVEGGRYELLLSVPLGSTSSAPLNLPVFEFPGRPAELERYVYLARGRTREVLAGRLTDHKR